MDFLTRNRVQKNLVEIKQDDQQGRYVVATAKIPAGTLIIEENPVVHGPRSPTIPVCLTCYHPVTHESPRCSKCGWPFCCENCISSETHESHECKAFQAAASFVEADKFKFNKIEEKYDIIYPLRMLLTRNKDPEIWDKCKTFETHVNQFGENQHYSLTEEGDILLERDMAVSHYIRKTLRMDEDDKTMTSLFGMFYTNDFETSKHGNKTVIRMMYLLPSLMNHSCVPNIRITFDNIDNGLNLKVVATKDIQQGELIYHSYVDNLDPTPIRQKKLKNSKFFNCHCKRCKDPKELGSLASAIRCPACKENFCLPMIEDEGFNENSSWPCQDKDGCGAQIPGMFAMLLLDKSKDEIETLPNAPETPPMMVIKLAEDLIDKFSKMFYPSNGLLMGIKMKLMILYGKHTRELSEKQLTRMMAVCTEMVTFLEKTDYKLSMRRGVAMYQLHKSLVLLGNNNNLQAKTPTEKEDARNSLKKGLSYLERSLNILKTETTDDFVKELYAEGQEALEKLQIYK